MGCWNGTCGLTSLPILDNEEVYVFILENRGNGRILPCLLPIRAKYNDYGGFKDVNGIGYNYILNALKENILEKSEYSDIVIDKNKLDLELINNAIHEGILVREYYGLKGFDENENPVYSTQLSRIDRMLVRKDVLDYYLSNFTNDYGYFDDNHEYIKKEYNINTLIEGIRAHVKYLENVKDDKYSLLFRENMFDLIEDTILLNRSAVDETSPNKLIYDYFHRMCDGIETSNLLNFNKIVANYYREGNYKEILILLEELLIGLVLNRLIIMTRKSWRHGVGDGSQSVCKKDYMILNEATKIAIDKLP